MTKEQLISEIRQAFADYYASEGCTCCENIDEHRKANKRLAELLNPDRYDDGGANWYAHTTEDNND